MARTVQLAAIMVGFITTLAIALIALPHHAHSRSVTYYAEFATGTGFFVNRGGALITNNHVIDKCDPDTIHIRNDSLPWTRVDLKARNPQHDLALLQSPVKGKAFAKLNSNKHTIRKGDSVLVIGYPEEHSHTGQYKFVTSEILDLKGPEGKPEWIQFRDVIAQGNSGGPLLDQAGNVIGVVTAKLEQYHVNRRNGQRKKVGESGAAVSLPTLQAFLKKSRIWVPTQSSWTDKTDRYVEHRAKDFIVNIRCVTNITPVSSSRR